MFNQYVKDSFTTPSINAINNLNMSQKNSVNPKPFYPNNYILLSSTSLTDQITSHNNKSLQKSLNIQHKKLSSLTRNCGIPTLTSNETITNLTQ